MKTELHQDALNDAGWKLLDELQKLMDVVPNRVFNNLKPALAATIEVYQIKAAAPAPWNGEDLPPVGLEVEIKLKSTRADWCPATVLFCQDDALVIAWKAEGVARPTTLSAVDIRPIRTAEQIAAEERERVANEMVRRFAFPASPQDIPWKGLFLQMYDCGVLKP